MAFIPNLVVRHLKTGTRLFALNCTGNCDFFRSGNYPVVTATIVLGFVIAGKYYNRRWDERARNNWASFETICSSRSFNLLRNVRCRAKIPAKLDRREINSNVSFRVNLNFRKIMILIIFAIQPRRLSRSRKLSRFIYDDKMCNRFLWNVTLQLFALFRIVQLFVTFNP